MGYSILPYVLAVLFAPVLGIGVSRIGHIIEEDPKDSGVCEMPREKVHTINQTFITQSKKESKYFQPGWRASKRIGLRKWVTTLYNVHHNESLPLLDGQMPPDDVLTHFFRCRGFATEHPLDPRLIETVTAAAKHFQTKRIEVISAYRSTKFNDTLSKKGRHVAAESKHTKGKAIDVRFVGTPAKDVGSWLIKIFEGGVGTYSNDDFVHIDTGPPRRWRGR